MLAAGPVHLRHVLRYEGAGLGLSVAQRLIGQLGGNIRVASVPGKWTRFLVELPMTAPEVLLPDPTSMDI